MIQNFQYGHAAARWNDGILLDAVRTGAERGVAKAASELRDIYRAMLSRPSAGKKIVHGAVVEAWSSRQMHQFRGESLEPRISKRTPLDKGNELRPAWDDPPRRRTGALMRSIRAERIRAALYKVGTDLRYGWWLEWGTKRMLPRPWLRPGLRNSVNLLKLIIYAEIEKRTAKGSKL